GQLREIADRGEPSPGAGRLVVTDAHLSGLASSAARDPALRRNPGPGTFGIDRTIGSAPSARSRRTGGRSGPVDPSLGGPEVPTRSGSPGPTGRIGAAGSPERARNAGRPSGPH